MAGSKCDHDWSRPTGDSWWDCSRCDNKMHPSWTPETRAQFEAACSILRLELTKRDEVVARVIAGR